MNPKYLISISDNESSKLGAKVNDWKAIGIDGTAIPRERVGP